MWLRLLSLLLACLLLSGCGLYNRVYSSSVPFTGSGSGLRADDSRDILNATMLRGAVLDLISAHVEHATFRFSNYSGSPEADLQQVCQDFLTAHPLGAWALASIDVSFSHVVSYDVADLHLSFLKNPDELASVVFLSTEDELRDVLRERLEGYAAGAALRIDGAGVDEARILALLKELYYADPVGIAAEPICTVLGYPAEGADRIYELSIDYGDSLASLRQMTSVLRRRVPQLCGELGGEAPAGQALAAARLVAATLSEDGDALASTAYGSLVLSEANDKGAALAYVALCDGLGIACQVVEGHSNGAEERAHWWNLVCLDGQWYHVDVTRLDSDPRQAFLATDAMLRGRYSWDAGDYPACFGALRYSDAAALLGSGGGTLETTTILELPVPGAPAPSRSVSGSEYASAPDAVWSIPVSGSDLVEAGN